jgi:NhaA family Na+:H+ antiporter
MTSSQAGTHRRLDRPVDAAVDHVLGSASAELTLVEYGSYACPRCRVANEEMARLRDRFGVRLRYAFRHRPLENNALARRAAELAECAADEESFWRAHMALMSRSATLTEEDLRVVADDLKLDDATDAGRRAAAAARVDRDTASSHASGVTFTPTFFINGARYDGAWDAHTLGEAMLGSLGHRVHAAALSFGSWAPSAALLLVGVTLLALLLSNSGMGLPFEHFWESALQLRFGSHALSLSLREWINDGLLTLFFLVVGLEVKREFTVGRLARPRQAALPIAAAIGGMLLPALFYFAIARDPALRLGAGVPMPTDTAFAVAFIVMLGSRIPIELRVFLTAASIVDDIGTIGVVALFYSAGINSAALLASALLVAVLVLLNRSGIYRAWPYAVTGLLLWAALHAAGVHPTLAGVLLALLIPTRPPANLNALLAQAEAVIANETRRGEAALRHGPSTPALQALDSIHDRIESPADRLLRTVEPWSSYLVLPLFALANAGLVVQAGLFDGHETLALAIGAGLVLGKPLGFLLASMLVMRAGLAERPSTFGAVHIAGAGALAGIGFTMSLFISGRAFPEAGDFAAAKAAVFLASALSAVIGCVILGRLARTPANAA